MVILAMDPLLKKEKIKDFSEAFNKVATKARQTKGCIEYKLLTNSKNPYELLCFERWKSKKEFTAHLKTPHMEKFFQLTSKWTTGIPRPNIFEIE